MDLNFSAYPRGENLIYFKFRKNTKSLNHVEEFRGRGNFQFINILLCAKLVEKAIMFLCVLFKHKYTKDAHPGIVLKI